MKVTGPAPEMHPSKAKMRRDMAASLTRFFGRSACLGLLLGLAIAGCGGGESHNAATKTPPVLSVDVSQIWLSETTVPTSGANLAAVVVNFTGKAIGYGVLGTFQHWTGTGWSPDEAWVTSLDQWGGFPAAGGSMKDAIIPLIGLSAPAHGVGGVQYFSLPALSKGWYRVGYPGGRDHPAVYGVIHVSPSAAKPVPIDNPRSPTMVAYPTIMSGSRDVGLVALPPSNGLVTADDVRQFNHGLAPSVTVQRWDGEAWVTLTTLTVHEANPPLSNTEEVAVTLPPLPSGAYRLVRHSRTAGDLARVVWVVGTLPNATDH